MNRQAHGPISKLNTHTYNADKYHKTLRKSRSACLLRGVCRGKVGTINGDTRLIPLTKGYSAIVDTDDYDWLMELRWRAKIDFRRPYAEPYVFAKGANNQGVSMHRLVVGAKPGEICDHIDRHPLNNRRSNLRLVTAAQNSQNSNLNVCNTSGYRGVTFHKKLRRWQAQIKAEGKDKYLGIFSTPIEAARAYDRAALELHGPEFAQLNFPDQVITQDVQLELFDYAEGRSQ